MLKYPLNSWMLLSDCNTEFMKHVFPRFRRPTTRRIDFRLAVPPPPAPAVPFSLLLSLEIVRLRGRNFRTLDDDTELLLLVVVEDDTDETVEGSSQPESLDDEVLLAVSWPDLDELISSIVDEVSDTVSPSPSFSS